MSYVFDFLWFLIQLAIGIIELVSVILVFAYLVLGFLYWQSGRKVEDENPTGMPPLRPLPIRTTDKEPLMKILIWVFEVRRWELIEDWRFKFKDEYGQQQEIILHKGFVFDGASIPRVLWGFLSPVGLLLIPGLVHDYGYKYDQLWQKDENGDIVPFKKDAGKDYWDELFRSIGEQVNDIPAIDFIAWLGVHHGGAGAWNKHRKIDAQPVPPAG